MSGDLPPFDPAASPKVGARYRHYKNKDYEVLALARHSETLEPLVVYRALYGAHDVWVRPLPMFLETLVVDGTAQPRFRLISAP